MDLKKIIKEVVNEKLVTGSPAPVKEPGVKPAPTRTPSTPRPRPERPSPIRLPNPGPATRPKAKGNKSIEAFHKNRSRK